MFFTNLSGPMQNHMTSTASQKNIKVLQGSTILPHRDSLNLTAFKKHVHKLGNVLYQSYIANGISHDFGNISIKHYKLQEKTILPHRDFLNLRAMGEHANTVNNIFYQPHILYGISHSSRKQEVLTTVEGKSH